MTKKLDSAVIANMTDWLGTRIKSLPEYDHRNWEPYDQAVATLKSDLVATYGAKVNDRWDGCTLAMGGLKASSTSGFVQACQNWRAQAVTKLAFNA